MSIQTGIPMVEYLCMDALSSGVAYELVTKSPMHARYKQQNSDRWSKKADLGTVVHQMLLEGHSDGVVWLPYGDYRKKDAQEMRDAAYADGKTPLLDSQKEDCDRLMKAVTEQLKQTELADVFGTGNAEVTVDWFDNGINCKARPDYLTEQFHISLKTTAASVEPMSFNRRVLTPSGYDFSTMFYDRGLRKEGWDGEHRILVIEQEPPYAIQIFELGTVKKDINAGKVELAIRTWAQCLETATFPGYPTTPYVADATPWEIAEAEERELAAMSAGGSR